MCSSSQFSERSSSVLKNLTLILKTCSCTHEANEAYEDSQNCERFAAERISAEVNQVARMQTGPSSPLAGYVKRNPGGVGVGVVVKCRLVVICRLQTRKKNADRG